MEALESDVFGELEDGAGEEVPGAGLAGLEDDFDTSGAGLPAFFSDGGAGAGLDDGGLGGLDDGGLGGLEGEGAPEPPAAVHNQQEDDGALLFFSPHCVCVSVRVVCTDTCLPCVSLDPRPAAVCTHAAGTYA